MSKAFNNNRIPFHKAYTKKLEKELKKFGVSVALQIQDGVNYNTFLLNGQYLSQAGVTKILRDLYEKTGTHFINFTQRQIRRAGVSPTPYTTWDNRLDTYFNLEGGEKIRTIIDTQQEQIRNVINSQVEIGVQEGLGIDAIEKDIVKSLKGKEWALTSKFNARRIALTEVNTASSMAGYEQMGMVKDEVNIQWVHNGLGKNPRLSHIDTSGQIREYGKPFDVGGVPMKQPHDSSLGAGAADIVNCYCSFRAVKKPN